jgi:hypothetical protein
MFRRTATQRFMGTVVLVGSLVQCGAFARSDSCSLACSGQLVCLNFLLMQCTALDSVVIDACCACSPLHGLHQCIQRAQRFLFVCNRWRKSQLVSTGGLRPQAALHRPSILLLQEARDRLLDGYRVYRHLERSSHQHCTHVSFFAATAVSKPHIVQSYMEAQTSACTSSG